MNDKTQKPLFRYDPDTFAKGLMELQRTSEAELGEAYRLASMKKFIAVFEQGYRQALLDYGIKHPDLNNPKA